MKKSVLSLVSICILSMAAASPILQMNQAFNALVDLIPYITDQKKFMENKNSSIIENKISQLQSSFKNAKHEKLLKEDIFAPSYELINSNLSEIMVSFQKGNKDYAHWKIKEITGLCLDCHTRMPSGHASSFQNGELVIDKSKFENVYNLGVAQLIVRQYVDAKESFSRSINEKLIKKDYKDLILPFKQILLIDAKVLRNLDNLNKFIHTYINKKEIPEDVHHDLNLWNKRLKHWQGQEVLKKGLRNDKDVSAFIANNLDPIKKNISYADQYDVDFLVSSGLLSNYLFENPQSLKAPDITYWLGWMEKYLKRENFFGSGDLFLKQCIKRYPNNPIAKSCFKEYQESVEFEFSGSAGTNVPQEVEKELNDLKNLIKAK